MMKISILYYTKDGLEIMNSKHMAQKIQNVGGLKTQYMTKPSNIKVFRLCLKELCVLLINIIDIEADAQQSNTV